MEEGERAFVSTPGPVLHGTRCSPIRALLRDSIPLPLAATKGLARRVGNLPPFGYVCKGPVGQVSAPSSPTPGGAPGTDALNTTAARIDRARGRGYERFSARFAVTLGIALLLATIVASSANAATHWRGCGYYGAANASDVRVTGMRCDDAKVYVDLARFAAPIAHPDRGVTVFRAGSYRFRFRRFKDEPWSHCRARVSTWKPDHGQRARYSCTLAVSLRRLRFTIAS